MRSRLVPGENVPWSFFPTELLLNKLRANDINCIMELLPAFRPNPEMRELMDCYHLLCEH